MFIHTKIFSTVIVALALGIGAASCKKLVTIPPPKDTISTEQVFNSDDQAESAMAGLYSQMINSDQPRDMERAALNAWSAGAVSILAGMSSGELYNVSGAAQADQYVFSTSKLTSFNSNASYQIWRSAYKSIYVANSIIEGIAASTSADLSEKTRKELTGEARFVRAFAYFNLINLFGDVPLALSVDFNETAKLPRAPRDKVYGQLIADLKEAQADMREDYTASGNERVRPSKWAATALLARVYLFTGDYPNAALAASQVIGQSTLFHLEMDLNNTFSKSGTEAIWQLKHATDDGMVRNATREGYLMIANPLYHGRSQYYLSPQLMSAFETGDKRRADWLDSTDNTVNGANPGEISFYPTKYKIGSANSSSGPATEYYVLLRLAEMYLIRAEARAHGADGGTSKGVEDLNSIRSRAGLIALSTSLDKDQLLTAIEQERQVEFFAEWGHRFFDLKRTGRAHDVLSAIPLKQPWLGDYQLLYPIPSQEIRNNPFLVQNPEYVL